MAEPERVNEVKEAILNHLKTVGPKDWEEIQKDFPDISNASFWRYVKSAKEKLKQDVVLTANPDLFTENNVENFEEQDPWERQHLNATFRGLKHGQRFYELYADALALREEALHGEGRIKNPAQFAKSIRIREQLLYAEMNVVDSIRETNAVTAAWDRVIDSVAKASPETAKEIMNSLHALNASEEAKGKKL